MPLYIAKSGDLDRCYRCLADGLTHNFERQSYSAPYKVQEWSSRSATLIYSYSVHVRVSPFYTFQTGQKHCKANTEILHFLYASGRLLALLPRLKRSHTGIMLGFNMRSHERRFSQSKVNLQTAPLSSIAPLILSTMTTEKVIQISEQNRVEQSESDLDIIRNSCDVSQ